MPEPSVRPRLLRHYDALRRALVTRHALLAAAVSALGIALAVAAGVAFPSGPTGAWARLIVTLAVAAVAIVLAVRAVLRAVPGFELYLERVEGRFPEVRSWLRNALDLEARPALHTSGELASALARETVERLDRVPLRAMTPAVEPRRPAVLIAGAFALVMALALLAPARVTRSWATLWNPALAAPPVRLTVEPGSVRVTPGAALAVRARVWGSAQRPRLTLDRNTRIEGTPEGDAGAAKLWRFDLTQLTRETSYQVRAASAESPRYRITLAGEPQPVSFEIEYRSPSYARLPVQRGAATRGDLSALRGTLAKLEVTFDRDLERLDAALPGGATSAWTAITPRRWRGEMPVEREGEYQLVARAAGGAGRYRYRVTPLADAPPLLSVHTPEGDLDLPNGQIVPLEVTGQDDFGLSELRLQVRKDPQAPWTTLSLARFPSAPREAQVTKRWDVAPLGLLPGEVASFRFELFDDNAVSGRGVATSPVFQIRFPTLGELYEQLDRKQESVQGTLEKVAEQAKELQKSLDKLGRQQPQSDGGRPEQNPSPKSFERQEELKNAFERQKELAGKIQDASEQLKQNLDQAAERKAFDEQLTRKLREMAELMDQVQSKQFKDALKKMQEAIEQLDRKTLEQNLPQWRQENQDMLKNLERTVELLKQLREEERLQALAQRANELKAQQDQLNQAMQDAQKRSDQGESEGQKAQQKTAEEQKKAAEESEQLAKDAQEAGKDSEQPKDREELEKAAEELAQEAAPAQREASEAAAKPQQGQKSKNAGQRASASLQKAAQQLGAMAKQKQQEREGADLAAIRRAAQDLVSLQRESEHNLDPARPQAERADRQTDLSEGTARVADSLYQLAKKSPFVTPQLGQALGRAIQQLSGSGKELGQGNRARGEEQGRSGSQLLNQAILELRQIENAMCQQPGGDQSGGQSAKKPGQKPGPETSGTAQRMDKLGQQQQRLNQQSRSLAERLSEQMSLSSGDRQELQRLAQEQQRIRQNLEQIQRDEESKKQLLGRLDKAQQEMKEVEEAMTSGTSDGSLEEKQNRILSRLLDASRSVNRRDFDPEREARPGENIVRVSPSELPTDLLKERDRLRLDLLKAEADRYPTQYRAFIESYLRSLNGSRR